MNNVYSHVTRYFGPFSSTTQDVGGLGSGNSAYSASANALAEHLAILTSADLVGPSAVGPSAISVIAPISAILVVAPILANAEVGPSVIPPWAQPIDPLTEFQGYTTPPPPSPIRLPSPLTISPIFNPGNLPATPLPFKNIPTDWWTT
jgi:hypothetical protein